jgi:alpha-1,3-rhamnosyl/mannosyltransferase
LPQQADVEQLRYYRQGQWVADPAALLQAPPAGAKLQRKKSCFRIRAPRWLKEYSLQRACRDQVFHGPNYMLPPCADIGVATVHDLSVFKFPETHPVERIRQFEREFAGSMARASHLITDSEATRKEVIDFLAWAPEKITAVPLGVSARFAPRPEAELTSCLGKYDLRHGGYALCVSTLEPRKKIGNLLLAYQCLPQRLREQTPLVLIGSRGWLSEELHQEIERLAQQGWLRYLGFIPEADLPAVYAGARTFIYPSSYEGFGLPVLEAMASGVPVVTSNRSSLPEVTKGAALLVDPDDIDALALAIEASLLDQSWRVKAMSAGLTVAQEFTWDRCIEKTVHVYKNIT